MIEQIYAYFTIEILYFWVNLGVLPFWLILIFFPQSNLCKYFVTSIFPILLLSGTYIFALYKSYLNSYDFDTNFDSPGSQKYKIRFESAIEIRNITKSTSELAQERF